MQPTLVGDDSRNIHHYGIADTAPHVVDNLKRFDVIITTFPKEWGSTDGLVVKRIWGFPGETITLTSTETSSTFTVVKGDYDYSITAPVKEKQFDMIGTTRTFNVYEFKTENKLFNTNTLEKRNFSITLEENQYFVMGDNWGSSSDSYQKKDSPVKISKNELKGKVICIQGYGKVDYSSGEYKISNKVRIKPIYNF